MSVAMIAENSPKFLPLKSAAPALKPLAPSDFVAGAKAKIAGEHEQLTEQAQKWVAQTFYGTLLKQMHESPFKTPWLDGGRGGQAFQPLLDQKLADHMVRSSGKKLVASIVKKIEGHKVYKKQGKKLDSKQEALTRHYVTPGLRA